MPIQQSNLEYALSENFPHQKWSGKSRGPLHDRMTKFLPDFVDEDATCCNIQRIAAALDMSPQGVYKMMRPNVKNRIDPKIAESLVILSTLTKKRSDDFVQATIADFWEFVNP